MAKIQILVGSVYGGALEVAEKAAAVAEQAGHSTEITEQPKREQAIQADHLLVVTSTTGSGELPEGLHPFYQELQNQSHLSKPFGVIALGDSSYGESFCAAGKLMDSLLENLGGLRLLPPLLLDALEFFDASEGADAWITAWVAKVSEKG